MWRTQAVKRSWSCWRQSCSGLMYQPHSLLQPWRQRNCHLVVVENLSWNNRRQIGTSPGEVPCCLLIRSGDTWWMMKSRVAISEISEWRFFEEFCLCFSLLLFLYLYHVWIKVSQLPVKYRNDNWWDYLEIIMERLRCPRYRLIPGETGESHNYHYHQVNWYKGR